MNLSMVYYYYCNYTFCTNYFVYFVGLFPVLLPHVSQFIMSILCNLSYTEWITA